MDQPTSAGNPNSSIYSTPEDSPRMSAPSVPEQTGKPQKKKSTFAVCAMIFLICLLVVVGFIYFMFHPTIFPKSNRIDQGDIRYRSTSDQQIIFWSKDGTKFYYQKSGSWFYYDTATKKVKQFSGDLSADQGASVGKHVFKEDEYPGKSLLTEAQYITQSDDNSWTAGEVGDALKITKILFFNQRTNQLISYAIPNGGTEQANILLLNSSQCIFEGGTAYPGLWKLSLPDLQLSQVLDEQEGLRGEILISPDAKYAVGYIFHTTVGDIPTGTELFLYKLNN